jgi:hypothetical protein
MDKKNEDDVGRLLDALRKMAATGESGFEGLMAAVLAELTGMAFRLAGSGSQSGSDGDARRRGDQVSFECKRYTKSPGKAELLSKVAELNSRDDVDLWVVCATAPVLSQHRQALVAASAGSGLEVAVIDWEAAEPLPDLAVAMAAVQPIRLRQSLQAMGLGAGVVSAILDGCEAIRARSGFAEAEARVRSRLDLPAISFASAKAANARWVRRVLASRTTAMGALGQPLAPADRTPGPVLPRQTLTDQLQVHMEGPLPTASLVLVGDEGVGKSWAPANAWLQMQDPPMLLLMPAESFDADGRVPPQDMVADTLARQVDGADPRGNPGRWRRKVARWLAGNSAVVPLTVVIDGVNQRPGFPWHTIINSFVQSLGKKGLRLCVSTRLNHFDAKLKGMLKGGQTRVVVNAWKPQERDEILAASDISPGDLEAGVARALTNPRLLSVALALMGKAELTGLRELSVERLLFEHIRATSMENTGTESPHDFVQKLAEHATRIRDRLERGELEDLKVFKDASAASEGRFFRPVPGSPNLYELKDEGLTLALGIALVEDLKRKRRNKADLRHAANVLIDPWSALDDAAKVLMAALTIACFHEEDGALVEVLLFSFAGMQNIPVEHHGPFCALARQSTQAYLDTLQEAVLGESPRLNREWLVSALKAARSTPASRATVGDRVKKWLALFNPLAMPPRRDDESDRDWQNRVDEHQANVQAKTGSLTARERALYQQLDIIPQNPAHLAAIAFELVAGMPVAPFVDVLALWRFGAALSPPFMAPFNEFHWLGEFNTADWEQARIKVNAWADALLAEDPSDVGIWAANGVLHLTGDAEDAMRAVAVRERLRKKPNVPVPWAQRSVPANPDEPSPPSIELHEVRNIVSGIDAGSMHAAFGHTVNDHQIDRHAPVLARFEPDIIIGKFREFIDGIPDRSGLPLRQGIFALPDLAPLVTPLQAHALLRLRREKMSGASSLQAGDVPVLSTLCLMYALPALSGDQQLEALLDEGQDEHLFLSLFPLFKAAAESTVERVVAAVIDDTDNRRKSYVLDFLANSGSAISPVAAGLLTSLIASYGPESDVHALAFLTQRGTDADLVSFASSPWTASGVRESPASRYGSALLVETVRRELLPAEEALQRIQVSAFGGLALAGHDGARVVARWLDSFFQRSPAATLPTPSVRLETHFRANEASSAGLIDATALPEKKTRTDFLESFAEPSADNFDRNQKQVRADYLRLRKEISKRDALVVLDGLEPDAFRAIAAACPNLARRWCDDLLDASDVSRRWLSNSARLLALHLAPTHPGQTLQLLAAYEDVEPAVHMVFGHARGTLDARVIWSLPACPAFDDLCTQRLESTRNDQSLASEVLAASLAGRGGFLSNYIRQSLAEVHPVTKARALTITGFMDTHPGQVELLQAHADTGGLPGAAAAAGLKAANSNAWARHWFARMEKAADPEDYWRYGVLLEEAIDARIDLWAHLTPHASPTAQLYWSVTESQFKHRLRKVEQLRQGQWLGQPKPAEEFYPT